MGMPAPPAAKKPRVTAPSHKRHYEPGVEDAPGEDSGERAGSITGEPPQSCPRTDAPQHQLMQGSTGPSGWWSTLLRSHLGRPVAAPPWYNSVESGAVASGRQVASTCGLHAMNHCLHALGHVFTWDEFDARALPIERRSDGDWEAAALHRNAQAAGAVMQPVFPDDYDALARWHDRGARLGIWSPEILGCVVHVPGHWVALTRPQGAQTPDNAALLCDSLRRQPFALSAVEVAQLFARMAQEQRRRNEPLLQLVSMQQGVAPLDT